MTRTRDPLSRSAVRCQISMKQTREARNLTLL
jgi:hypothetical protein